MPDKKPTVRSFRKMKQAGEKIVMITAYDAPTAGFVEAAGLDMILVGDSVGMAMLGYTDTVPVTMDDMIHHSRIVRRGAPRTFVVGDMPFLSYQLSMEQALANAGRFIQSAGCDAVKLECEDSTVPVVARMVEAGIPVMGHIGLLPQGVKTAGGYRVAGRDEDAAAALKKRAHALEDAGAFSIVLECVPEALAAEISRELEIPAIGIGAGVGCDGQVQVVSDLLGIGDFLPKHAKRYACLGETIRKAFEEYADDVRGKRFPAKENSF